MKAGWGFIISGVIIIAIGIVWLFFGMSATDIGQGITTTVSLPRVIPTSAPPTTVPVTVVPTGTAVVAETITPSADAAKLHFLDLAFDARNPYLERWSETQNNGRIVISMVGNRDADAMAVQTALLEFNSLSRTNQISTQVKQGSATGDIVIKFVTEDGMSAIPLNSSESLTNKEFVQDGRPVAKVTLGTIYINNDLKGDERSHVILRSLFYELGLVGTTDLYPDSLFYSGSNTNTALSLIDKEAIRLLYGTSLKPGMTANEVRSLLFVR
ncbi:DUF2927 domain-containing protein [Methanoregula formicica]|uniref:Uncharacterized protein n=1 Tax=Methanoregula formicica (strain DSM 22288 / NBRC 105244 / SMSP) TaxID=593750 RepID=L0H9U6_METFS|nr:DUF2927 domain-containing protein [Methanoregula formicica]AGB01522.1 Protein of unknown function (DUF2927) [Methanoregula formicica SMSP]